MAVEKRQGPGRAFIVALSVIAVLVVASLALILVRGGPERIDPSTPAGVVQRYSQAVLAGDSALAESLLSERARANCASGRSLGGFGFTDNMRIELRSTTERDTTATVRVAIIQTSQGGPFGPSEYTQEDTFGLVRADGQWLVDAAPYMLSVCGGPGVKY